MLFEHVLFCTATALQQQVALLIQCSSSTSVSVLPQLAWFMFMPEVDVQVEFDEEKKI